jgi:hypothetical protein
MSTYFRAFRPAKTVAGNEDSWLLERQRSLDGRREETVRRTTVIDVQMQGICI